MYYYLHPDYNEFAERLKSGIDPKDINYALDERLSKDDEVIRTIQKESSAENTLVIVSYGAAHMPYFQRQLSSIDVNATPSILPFTGEDHFKCEKPDIPMCVQFEKTGTLIDFDALFANQRTIKIPDINNVR